MHGKTVTIFNRSEVVGRPLASMLANDGARVFSFDISGPLLFEKGHVAETTVSREEALSASQVVITGVPSRDFPLVRAREIGPGAVCINVSTLKNFADDITSKAAVMVPRVGPMTVAMALRNTLRLYDNYHAET
jgi:methylenetetrahydrofolate dehydrogenase (NADP+)/methenyltetrahydrofolate cyclohydrolase